MKYFFYSLFIHFFLFMLLISYDNGKLKEKIRSINLEKVKTFIGENTLKNIEDSSKEDFKSNAFIKDDFENNFLIEEEELKKNDELKEAISKILNEENLKAQKEQLQEEEPKKKEEEKEEKINKDIPNQNQSESQKEPLQEEQPKKKEEDKEEKINKDILNQGQSESKIVISEVEKINNIKAPQKGFSLKKISKTKKELNDLKKDGSMLHSKIKQLWYIPKKYQNIKLEISVIFVFDEYGYIKSYRFIDYKNEIYYKDLYSSFKQIVKHKNIRYTKCDNLKNTSMLLVFHNF